MREPTFTIDNPGKAQEEQMCRRLIEIGKVFFQNPENQRKFEEWQKNRELLSQNAGKGA